LDSITIFSLRVKAAGRKKGASDAGTGKKNKVTHAASGINLRRLRKFLQPSTVGRRQTRVCLVCGG